MNFSIPLNPYIAYHDNNLDLGESSTKKGQYFWEHEPSCFHLDRICHRDDEWFYDHPVDVKGGDLHQPTISLDMPDEIVDGTGEVSVDDRIHFTVRQRERWRLRIFSQANNRQCHYSDTPYHVVVQSSFNDMMGEFYLRSVLGLNEWMQKFPLQLSSIKFYVHFATKRNQLFVGHRLFLGENTTDSFSSLIIPQFRQPNSCQCYEKLVFCGYNRDKSSATFTAAGYIGHPSSKTLNEYLGGNKGKEKNPAYQRLRQDLLARHAMRDPISMGTIFIDTDLNHLGYVLDRDSVPLCQNVSRADAEQEKNCLIGEGDRFTWTNRDFIVDKTIITQFILMFLLNNDARCDDMRRRATENDFVLYNSFCTQGNEFHTEHHYLGRQDDNNDADEESDDSN